MKAISTSGLMWAAMLVLGGCHKAPAPPAAPAAAHAEAPKPQSTDAQDELVLTPQQIQKIGLKAQAIKAAQFGEEVTGYGVITPHEAIAQGVAEWVSARAVEKQSQAALARLRKLAGTPGAMSADTQEAATRQAAVDSAAATLARQRLSSTLGQKLPWDTEAHPETLKSLAGGDTQLLRVTFPLGSLPGKIPNRLRAARIGAPAGQSWSASQVWAAPADAAVPGRSFFGLLHAQELAEGERMLVFAPVSAAQAGVLIPREAVLVSDGKYWCYIELSPGSYRKSEVDTARPFEDGYFQSEGFTAGEKVVTQGAAHLLAQQSNSGADED